MRYAELRTLRGRLYFTVEDMQDLLGIKLESARVLCSRYAKQGLFVRLKKNFYVLSETWVSFSMEKLLRISNILQVPSYISLTTALAFYDVTTQVQRNYFESVSLKRSVNFDIMETVFNFYKIQKRYYFDFIKEGDIFIATKEKAFIDSVYLYSFGKYKIDFASIDIDKLDKNKVINISEIYPEKTKDIIRRICRI